MEEQLVKEQIRLLLRTKGVSITRLAAGDASLQKKLNNQINGETALSVQTLLYIISKFPNISSEWLLRGTGNMFLDIPLPGTGGDLKDALIQQQAETIAALKETIAILKKKEI